MDEFDGGDKDFPAEDCIDSLLNLDQFSAPPPRDDFDVAAVSQNDILDEMFSSLLPSTSFPWVDSYQPPVANLENQQPPLSPVEAKALLLQQQFQLAAGNAPMCHGDQNDVVDGGVSFPYPNLTNDASVEGLFNGFEASLPQNSIQSYHFNNPQSQNYGTPATSLPISPPAAIGSSSGATAAQPRQRVRARRGQATDPHSIAERLRRERIAERMKSLQELVPNSNKMDKATMLDEIIDYVKFLQLQVKVLSVSRLGGGSAASVAPSIPDYSHEGRGQNDGVTVTEQKVAKLLEEDMGAAMQYLQGKGLCLMPISLATIVSTSRRSSHFNRRAAHSSSTIGEVSTIEDAGD